MLGGRDVVLVRGIEPNIRWRSFVTEIIDVADELDVEMVVVLGALLADVPHTRPVPLTATTGNADLRAELGLTESTYEGPTGIVGVLQDACARTDIPSLAVWAAVPHYVAQPPCPKATLALLSRVEDLLDARIPPGDLPEDARAWELRRRRARGRGPRGRGVRPHARGGQGRHRAARGQRRGDRQGVRALPAPSDRPTDAKIDAAG